MSTITPFTNGQATINKMFSLMQTGEKEKAVELLHSKGNGIPKVFRGKIQHKILKMKDFNEEAIKSLEKKCIILLDPKEKVLEDSKFARSICSYLNPPELARVSTLNHCFQNTTEQALSHGQYLMQNHKNDHMLFPMIFSYLPAKEMNNLALVSHAFNDQIPATHSAQLKEKKSITIQEIKLYQKLLKLKDNDFAGVLICCSNLETFDLGNSKNYTLEEVEEISQLLKTYCPKLKVVNFRGFIKHSNYKSHVKCVISIVKQHPHLTILDFANSGIRNKELSKILDSSSNLTTLECGLGCHQITDEGIEGIDKKCPQLSVLNLSFVRITDECLLHLPSSLTSLNLYCVYPISNQGLNRIGLQCPHLQFLNLTGCYNITNEGLAAFAGNFQKLESLNLFGVRNISAQDIAILMQNCPSITSLCPNLRQVTDEDLQLLLPHFSKLTTLELPDSDISRQQLAILLKNCPFLTFLDISKSTNISRECCDEIRMQYPHIVIKY